MLCLLAKIDAGFSVGEWEKGFRYHGSSQCNGQVTVLFAEYLPHIVTIQHIKFFFISTLCQYLNSKVSKMVNTEYVLTNPFFL